MKDIYSVPASLPELPEDFNDEDYSENLISDPLEPKEYKPAVSPSVKAGPEKPMQRPGWSESPHRNPIPNHLLPDKITEESVKEYNLKLKTIQQNFIKMWGLLNDKLVVEDWQVADPNNPTRNHNYREWFDYIRKKFFDMGLWRLAGKESIEMHNEVVRKVHDTQDTIQMFATSMFTFIQAMTDELAVRDKLNETLRKEKEEYRQTELKRFEEWRKGVEAHVAGEKIQSRQIEQTIAKEIAESNKEHEKMQILSKTWDEFIDAGVTEQQWQDYKKIVESKIKGGINSKAKSLVYLSNVFKKAAPPHWQRVAYCQVIHDNSAPISERFSVDQASNLLAFFVDFASPLLNNITLGETGPAGLPEEL